MRVWMLGLSSALFAATAAGQDDSAAEAQLVIDVSVAGDEARGTAIGSVTPGRLRSGARRSFRARLEPGKCYLFVARGGAGVDNIDLSVARGRTVLGRDAQTDARAEVRHCAGDRREQVRWTVSAFRGQGPFAAGLFEVPQETAEIAEATGTPLERLEALAQAHAADMAVVTPPRRESLLEGARVERTVTLASGRCYRVIAAGAESIADLDLALLAPDGGALQTDTGEASSAHLGVLRPLCPAVPGEHRVAIRAHTGSGDLAWQIFGSGARGAARAAPPSRYRVGGTGSGFVNERLRERHRALGRGMPPVTDVVTGSLRTSEARSVPLPVEGGRCYMAIAAGVPSVRELDLRVVDPFGNERARDSTRDAFPATGRFCPPVSGRWTVEVRMFNGYGQWAMQVFGAPR